MITFGRADTAASAVKTQTNLIYPPHNRMKVRLTVGEKRFPATEDLRGAAMFYRSLLKLTGNEAFAISRNASETTSFIAGFDLESAPLVQHSGLSTLNAPLNVFIEDLFQPGDIAPPTGVFLHTSSDALLEVSRRGVTLSI